MRTGRAFAAMAVAVALPSAACNPTAPAHRPAAAPAVRTVPPAQPPGAMPASTPPRPSGRRYPACRATQLRASVGGYDGLTGGTAFAYVYVRNVSARSCSLSGTPTVIPLDAAGRAVALHRVLLDGDYSAPAQAVALIAHPRDPAWAEALVPMSVSGLTDQGNPCPDTQTEAFAALRVTFGGNVLRVPVRAGEESLGTCEGRFRNGWFIAAGGA